MELRNWQTPIFLSCTLMTHRGLRHRISSDLVNKDIQKEYEASSDARNIKEIQSDGKWIVSDIDMADIGYFGGWEAATQKFFSDGGIFDKIYD